MRLLGHGALLAALGTGCIVSEPEGTAQYWPPALGGTVEAVASGDFNADGKSDIVVVQSGNEHQAGLYFIEGGQDLEIGATRPVTTFSRFIPEDWHAPMAAYVVPGVAPQLYVAHTEDKVELSLFSNALHETATYKTTIVGGSPTLWTRPITFPGGQVHPAASNGAFIDHIDAANSVRPVPADGGTWSGAQVATSYATGSETVIVVATDTQLYRATLPTTPGSPFVYQPVRADGRTLRGQVAFDLDGDMREEIIGFDVDAHDVCVIDPGATAIPVATLSCVHIVQSAHTGTDVTILLGQNFTQNPGNDILIAQATGSETSYSLVEDYTYVSATGFSFMTAHDIPGGGGARGRSVLATAAPGMPWVVLTFGTDASVSCAVGPC